MNSLINFDISLFQKLNGLLFRNEVFDFIIMILAKYLVYMVPLGLLLGWFLSKEKEKISLIKTTIVSVIIWQTIPKIISMIWFRPRPIAELAGSKELVFHVPSYSFPSDHSTFLAALATYLYMVGLKKVGITVYIAAFLVGISRVVAGLHFPGDVLVGWLIGISFSYLLFKADKVIEKYIAKPILNLAKKIRLA